MTQRYRSKVRSRVASYLLGKVQEGDVPVVESRLHFPPLRHILYKPNLKQTTIIITVEGKKKMQTQNVKPRL